MKQELRRDAELGNCPMEGLVIAFDQQERAISCQPRSEECDQQGIGLGIVDKDRAHAASRSQ